MIRQMINRAGLDWMLRLNPQTVRADVFAGAAGAAVVLPQAVAFAAIAGLPPEYGVYTAIITPIVAALCGSSLIMVSGPTTAISAVVFSALADIAPVGSPQFIQNAITLAFLVGLIQLAFAFIRIGRVAGFVSHSVMLGFTAAAAVHIAISQIAPALGIDGATGGVIARATALAAGWSSASLIAMASAGCIQQRNHGPSPCRHHSICFPGLPASGAGQCVGKSSSGKCFCDCADRFS